MVKATKKILNKLIINPELYKVKFINDWSKVIFIIFQYNNCVCEIAIDKNDFFRLSLGRNKIYPEISQEERYEILALCQKLKTSVKDCVTIFFEAIANED